jgi:methionyl-tRNA formyltransferase
MGTPEFAVPSLHAAARVCEVAAVVTQPDRPRGRGRRQGPPAVAEAARALGLDVFQPERVNAPDSLARIAALEPDLIAVVAFGAILGADLLRAPSRGAINLHGSLLPDYRGASPVQRALWDGRAATGVTTIWMDEGIDTGDVILQRWAPIEPGDDAGSLAARLASLGGPLLAESLVLAHEGRAPRHPQDRAAGSYAPRLGKEDGAIDWALDAESVWCRQRAVTPWPGAATGFLGRRVQVLASRPLDRLEPGREPGTVVQVSAAGVDVACRPGTLRVLRVKPEGKPEMSAGDWARGARIAPGQSFTHLKEIRV